MFRTVPPGDTAVGLGAQQLGAGRGPGVVRAGAGQTGQLHGGRGRRQRQPGADRGLSARGAAGPAHVGRRGAAHVPERVRAQRGRRGGQEQLPGGRHHQPVAGVRRVQRLERGVRRAQISEIRVRQRRQQVRPAVRRRHQRGAMEVQLQRHTGKRFQQPPGRVTTVTAGRASSHWFLPAKHVQSNNCPTRVR